MKKSALAARLEEAAAAWPRRVAIRDSGGAMTCAELWAASGDAALALTRRGAHDGQVVVLSNANGAAWLTTFFGALRADCVVAVVDPKLPAEAWEGLRQSLDPAAVFTKDSLTFRGSSSSSGVLATPPPDFRRAGGRFLYFTSGSTGLPKGVLLGEETLAANVAWNSELLALGQEDVGSLFLPLSHSYNLVFALCFVLSGATLLVERDLSDLHGVVARMDAAGVTVLQHVPTSLRTLVERADLERSPLLAVRAVRVGAGVLTDDLAARTLAAFPRASIVATYGMTELGLVASRTWSGSPIAESTFDRLVPDLTLELSSGDEDGDGDGEIEISHPLLFKGYFDASSRSLSIHEGRYRTGDLGVWASPGVLSLRSRKKAVAKVAGVLVNLEEISRIASGAEGVADCCTIAVPDPLFGEAVHVFLVASPERRLHEGEVARHIMEHTLLRTAPRMHVLERLPRNDAGKLARKTLEDLAQGRRE